MYEIAIVGATGVVGQQFVVALQNHPMFKIIRLAASEKSAGKKYGEALRDNSRAFNWFCDEEPSSWVLDLDVEQASKIRVDDCDLIFTALGSEQAKTLEPKYAQKKPVISTASAFRYELDVPILIPGVNSEHVHLLNKQRENRGWRGFITPIPNCTTTGLAITLKPIYEDFGLNSVFMTSMQAVSGAGRSPGVIALDIVDNVIPYIPEEEEKVETETLKILGSYKNGAIKPATFNISSTCTRVNVREGHTESVFTSTRKKCAVEEVKQSMIDFGGEIRNLGLFSAPKQMIIVQEDPFRPQPRLDRNTDDGMATTVGRIRQDQAITNGIKYVLVSHNTKMGAAKGAVLVAELLEKSGYLK